MTGLDDLDRLLSSPLQPLPPPAGTFGHLRRRATRRRRVRTALTVGTLTTLAGVVTPLTLQLGADPTSAPTGRVPDVSASLSATLPPDATHHQRLRCLSRDLHVSLRRAEPAAGDRYATLVLTNTGDRACRLRGHPTVTAMDAAERPIGSVASPAPGDPVRRVTLAPGADASTVLHWAGDAAGRCRPESTHLRVLAPGSTHAVAIPARIQLCGGVFDVRNLTAGSTGMTG